MSESPTIASSEAGEPVPTAKAGRRAAQAHSLKTLEQLAHWHPALFGATFLPLKRGIFQELLQAHAGELEDDALKSALAFHTRSTAYLVAVAAGQPRHDLQGQPVEAMAPEHVHQALMEVFRRRQARTQDDLRPKLRDRIARAYEASGLSRADYDARVRGRDEAANALLDEALVQADASMARDEAQLRAFEASGQALEGFADMYGLSLQAARQTLERARARRERLQPGH